MKYDMVSRLARRRLASRRLLFQSLEPRMVLAGNVVASLVGDTLRITGDNADNAVFISTYEDSENGIVFRVEGFEHNGTTTVNGQKEIAEFVGVKNLSIDLKGGDDDLGISNDVEVLAECLGLDDESTPEMASFNGDSLHVPGSVVIKMGDGENRVGIGPAHIGKLQIQGGKHSDFVGLCDVHVANNLTIQTFAGEDGVLIRGSSSGGDTNIQTGDGNGGVLVEEFQASNLVVQGGRHEDEVAISGAWIAGDLIIQTKAGDDFVEVSGYGDIWDSVAPEGEEDNGMEIERHVGDLLLIETGDGYSKVGVEHLTAGQISIRGGRHDDSVYLEYVCTELDISVNTLAGHDDVEADTVEARSLIILTGAGNDDVFVGGYDYGGSFLRDDLTIKTDGGRDRVAIGFGYGATVAEGENGQMDGLNVGDDLVVDTGSDTDLIDVFGYRIGGEVLINAGSGDDSGMYRDAVPASSPMGGGGVSLRELEVGGGLTLLLGAGRDAASVAYAHVGGNVKVDAGSGDDSSRDPEDSQVLSSGGGGVELHDMTIEGELLVLLGSGHDQASINGVLVGKFAKVDGGSGNDQVELVDIEATDGLFAYMGSGDDDLFVDGCKSKVARFFGGTGRKDRFFAGSNEFESEEVKEFESTVI